MKQKHKIHVDKRKQKVSSTRVVEYRSSIC